MRNGCGISFFARLAACFHEFSLRLLFELRAQFAVLDGIYRSRDFLFMFFERPHELLLQLFEAQSLSPGPFRLQALSFFGELLGGAHGLAFELLAFVAAAAQKRDESA